MIQEGKYEAKLVNYGVKETKAGKAFVFADFSPLGVEGADDVTVHWTGWLTEGASLNTLKSLIGMGLSTMDIELLKEGPPSGLLDMDKTYNITVEEDEYNGQTTLRVRWINQARKLSAAVDTVLGGLKGDLKKLLDQQGVKSASKPTDVGF